MGRGHCDDHHDQPHVGRRCHRPSGRALYPVGDIALIDLTVDRVFTAGSPLLGAYSRFGWYHPGPSMYWLLAPFSVLAGGRPWGPVVGIAVVQAAAIALCARLAWRRSGLLVTQAVLLVQALSYVALRTDYPVAAAVEPLHRVSVPRVVPAPGLLRRPRRDSTPPIDRRGRDPARAGPRRLRAPRRVGGGWIAGFCSAGVPRSDQRSFTATAAALVRARRQRCCGSRR